MEIWYVSSRCSSGRKKIMTKIVVRLPEPKREYSEDNQRQINRTLSSLIQQLNSTYQQPEKDDAERFNFFLT
jgi:hypothetical protein